MFNFAGLAAGVIPLALAKLAQLPIQQKQAVALFLADCCTAYAAGDREKFNACLDRVKVPDDQRPLIDRALWG